MISCRLLAVQLWGLWGVGLTMPGEVGREAKERGRRAGQVKLCETMMGPVRYLLLLCFTQQLSSEHYTVNI